MSAVPTFVSRRAPRIAAPLAWVVLAFAVLVLLASVAVAILGDLPPVVDEPRLAPFRWERLSSDLA
jgi:hypothetical protein